jgi:hypothetical protein
MITPSSAIPAVRLTIVSTVSRRRNSRGDRRDRRSTGPATCESLRLLLPAAGTLLERFGCGQPAAAVPEGVLPAPASAHATNTGQLAAKPASTGDTSARRRALERA